MTLRLYREHAEYGSFAAYDTMTGRRRDLDEAEYRNALRAAGVAEPENPGRLIRIEGDGATLFTGETPQSRTRFPRRVYFQITRNCNLSCGYCFLGSAPGLSHVPRESALRLAAFLGKHGLMEVRLTGGEPTTHPDLFSIVDAFRDNDVYVSIATNGVFNQRIMEGIAERKGLWLICSVDGNRQVHNHYRPGTFDAIMRNLRRLKQMAPDLRLRLTTVLTTRNAGQVRQLAEIARSLDAESLTIIPLRPKTRDEALKGDMITAERFRTVIEEMVRVMRELDVRMTTTLATDYEEHIHQDPVVRKHSACAAGREATNIDYDSNTARFLVYGCSYSPACDLETPRGIRDPFLAGEFDQADPRGFLDIWRDDDRWALFRNPRFKAVECMECRFYREHHCIGSCPIQNIDYRAIDASNDVLEQLAEQIAKTSEWYCYQKVFPG